MFSSQTPYIGIWEFVINLALATILAYVLGLVYARYGTSISNRRMFARNLTVISMTTMLIITIVKSSLALSLGLVGALSIVRFRTAIKEPEELSFLFLSIAVGLGMGAGQRLVTIIGFCLIIGIIILRKYKNGMENSKPAMLLTVSSDRLVAGILDSVIGVLEKQASLISLKRIDETKNSFQGDFLVAFPDYDSLNAARKDLKDIDDTIKISFLDSAIL